MKYYEIVTIKNGDEYPEYEGFNLEEALEEKEKAIDTFNAYLTASEKATQRVECRVYDIPDDTDIADRMAIAEACRDCAGYDLF